jgi:hypothetical protein
MTLQIHKRRKLDQKKTAPEIVVSNEKLFVSGVCFGSITPRFTTIIGNVTSLKEQPY